MTDYFDVWLDHGRPGHRVHPALGAVPVSAHESLRSLTDDRLPPWFVNISEDVEDDVLETWLNRLLSRVSLGGRGVAYVDLSDRRGEAKLRAVPGCVPGPRPLSYMCPLTRDGIEAVIGTNPTLMTVVVDGEVVLTLSSDWDGLFLHVQDESLISEINTWSDSLRRSHEPAY